MIAEVIVDILNSNVDKIFDYIIPENLELKVGQRVLVPFANFSKEGYESKHNINCWNQKEYKGLGLAAHSYINDIRFSNICDLNSYIENIEKGNFEKNIVIEERKQTKEEKQKEYMLLGLRKIDGIKITDFENKFNVSINIFKNEIEKLLDEKLIVKNNECIKLSNKGIDLANMVWEEFI